MTGSPPSSLDGRNDSIIKVESEEVGKTGPACGTAREEDEKEDAKTFDGGGGTRQEDEGDAKTFDGGETRQEDEEEDAKTCDGGITGGEIEDGDAKPSDDKTAVNALTGLTAQDTKSIKRESDYEAVDAAGDDKTLPSTDLGPSAAPPTPAASNPPSDHIFPTQPNAISPAASSTTIVAGPGTGSLSTATSTTPQPAVPHHVASEAETLAHRLLAFLPPGPFVVCLSTEPGHPPYTDRLRRDIHDEVAKFRPPGQTFFLLLPHEYARYSQEDLSKWGRPSGEGWRV